MGLPGLDVTAVADFERPGAFLRGLGCLLGNHSSKKILYEPNIFLPLVCQESKDQTWAHQL
ncbi:unnamed protein product [Prunus armeniaca]